MIKSKKLYSYDEKKYEDLDGQLNIRVIKEIIEDNARNANFPLSIEFDEISDGGFLNKDTTPCLVLSCPSHQNDYLKFVIYTNRVGNFVFINIYTYGASAQGKYHSLNENAKQLQQEYSNCSPDDVTATVVNLFSLGVEAYSSIRKNKNKKNEEDQYYAVLAAILEDSLPTIE